MQIANVIFVIPAYNPLPRLVDLVRELMHQPHRAIIVVNDGSRLECAPIFDELVTVSPTVTLLVHGVNLGKGAALKTAFNQVLVAHPDATGVVTLDADGQHRIPDAMKVAEGLAAHPDALSIGSRAFSGNVPLRSRLGNILTCQVFKLLVGKKLIDTQSGLRGIPMGLLPTLMHVGTSGYDFELDMLIECKLNHVAIHEVAIDTVYEEGNPTSHFNPFLDSLRIYLVFVRFALSSSVSAIIDYLIFSLTFTLFGSLLFSQFFARMVAGVVNCVINYKFVFNSNRKFTVILGLYLSLLIVMGFVSYSLILLLNSSLGVNVFVAKLISELTLYFINFIIQRDFIFLRQPVLQKILVGSQDN